MLRLLDELFATGARDDWVARLRGADIVSAPINTLLEASNDPDVLANGYVTEIDYPEHGKTAEGARLALAFLGNAGPYRRRPAARRSTMTKSWPASATARRRSTISGQRKII